MAHLVVDKKKISENVSQILDRCHKAGVSLLTVFKEGTIRRRLLEVLFEAGVDRLGVAHYPNPAYRIPRQVEKILLYLTPWSALDEIVSSYDMSFQSDPDTVERLAVAAARQKVRHRVLLVAEAGDLRDGLPMEELCDLAAKVAKRHSPNIEISGIAANFACLNDSLPTKEIFIKLVECTNSLKERLKTDNPVLSVGGSDVLEWIDRGNRLPTEVTEIRCGTAVLLGTYPYSDNPIPGTNTDTITLEAEVLECRVKQGRVRAVMDFGTLDTSPEDVRIPLEGMSFEGASSGYTVFDVTECKAPVKTGMHLSFRLNYHSLSRAFLSPKLTMKIVE